MILDGGKVRAARLAASGTWAVSQRQVEQDMSLLGAEVGRRNGRWLSRVERGEVTDVPEVTATVLAAVLGVGLTELVDLSTVNLSAPEAALVIERLAGELAVLGARLGHIGESVTGIGVTLHEVHP